MLEVKDSPVEKLICIMIMLDNFRDEAINSDAYFFGLLVVLFVLNHLANFTSVKTAYLLASSLAIAAFRMTGNQYFYCLAVFGALLNLYGWTQFYKLPEVPDWVGYMRTTISSLGKNLNTVVMYPTKKLAGREEQDSKKQVDWLLPQTLHQMFENSRNPAAPVHFRVFEFFFRFLRSHKLHFSTAQPTPVSEIVIFSHGRGANTHTYSTLLSQLAQNRVVVTVQHSEQIKPVSADPAEEKKFREQEVQARADEIVAIYEHINSPQFREALFGSPTHTFDKVYLMGHSYGGSTSIEALQKLSTKQTPVPIHGLVLLDPWLFPLVEARLKAPLSSRIPTLMITNEYFVADKAIQAANYKFIKVNGGANSKNCGEGVTHINLEGADHLVQSDMCYIIGNMQGMVRNSRKTATFMAANVALVEQFLREPSGEDISQKLTNIHKQIEKLAELHSA